MHVSHLTPAGCCNTDAIALVAYAAASLFHGLWEVKDLCDSLQHALRLSGWHVLSSSSSSLCCDTETHALVTPTGLTRHIAVL